MPDNLQSQQLSLSSSDYDLRITNLARFIYKRLPIKKGTFIDIGAGNGLFLKCFLNKGFNAEGIELEKDQVHQMKEDYKLKDVSIRQGDISKLKGNQSYDVVVASDVIEHIENDKQALENLYSFVKPWGYLVITVPAHQFLFGKRDIGWGHHRRYNKIDLIDKLTVVKGAKVININYWNTLGFFAYFFFEKILKTPIREEFRYKKSFFSSAIRFFLDKILRFEEVFGSPIGLTLVAIIQKT
ncbi:MAG: class I SAM-dependent methyltransferase [Patescibacteria group bacterium]